MRMVIALCLGVIAPATAQQLAALRPLAVVEEPALRLGDLFEGLTAVQAATPIGASPAPGRRMVLEVRQLFAIARAHGIAWRPLSAEERVVVERPGRQVPREEIEATLRADLARLGLSGDSELDLGGLLPPVVPPGAAVQLAAEAVTYDAASGRFAATLIVMAEGMPTLRQRIAGRCYATLSAVVATRRMLLGEVIGPGDVRLTRLRVERARPGMAQRLDQVVGQQVRRPIGSDMPVQAGDLGAPSLVEKNALVTMILEAPGLSLTAQGRALDAAPRGATVSVVNLVSHMIVEGQVIAPGRVRVAMGAGSAAR